MAQRNGQDLETLQVQFMTQQLREVPNVGSEPKPVIFRLPAWYHETNKHLYEPKMVAIGPYHHGKENLRAMEEHKWYSLRNFLNSSTSVELKIYFHAVSKLEGKARHCYSESVRMASPAFIMMLLLDACFIIDYFENFKNRTENRDAICRVGWADIHLYSDLYLLENQIPFFVIHELIAIRDGNGSHNCLNNSELLGMFCRPLRRVFSTTPLDTPIIPCNQIDHLLQLYYISMVPKQYNVSNRPPLQQENELRSVRPPLNKTGINIPCVSELHDAGITFKIKQNPRNMFDISFLNGTMEIPFIKIEDTHKVILWNMAAFEQSQIHVYTSQILSSYLALMDSLIDTEMDVSLLVRKGIVENYLQSNEDAAELFNQFAKSFVLDYSKHHYQKLFQDLKEYSRSVWHRNRARLKHDYFQNPWTTISVLAAAVLLILTAAQTFFSYVSTYNKK